MEANQKQRREYPEDRYVIANGGKAGRILNAVNETGNPVQVIILPGEQAEGVRLQKNPDDWHPKASEGLSFSKMSKKDAKAKEEGGETEAEAAHRAEVEKTRAMVAEQEGRAPRESGATKAAAKKGK